MELQVTRNNSTSIQSGKALPFTTLRSLVTVRQSHAARALTDNNLQALVGSVGNTIAGILDRPTIAMLKKVVDTPLLEMFVAVVITDMIDGVNIDQRLNIQGHQVPIIAAQLVEQYPAESLEDFVLCFRRGMTGFYGTIYNLDASVLNLWMKAYLEEKYCLIEADHAKSKKEEAELGKVDYKAYIERKAKEMEEEANRPPSNAKDNEVERFKLSYFDSPEYQRRKARQDRIMRASSEFYQGQPEKFKELKIWEDESGLEIPALTEQDAEEIFKRAMK